MFDVQAGIAPPLPRLLLLGISEPGNLSAMNTTLFYCRGGLYARPKGFSNRRISNKECRSEMFVILRFDVQCSMFDVQCSMFDVQGGIGPPLQATSTRRVPAALAAGAPKPLSHPFAHGRFFVIGSVQHYWCVILIGGGGCFRKALSSIGNTTACPSGRIYAVFSSGLLIFCRAITKPNIFGHPLRRD